MFRHRQNYYQIYRVDHKRNLEQMVDEVEGLHEAEKLVEDYLRSMTVAEINDEISLPTAIRLTGRSRSLQDFTSGGIAF